MALYSWQGHGSCCVLANHINMLVWMLRTESPTTHRIIVTLSFPKEPSRKDECKIVGNWTPPPCPQLGLSCSIKSMKPRLLNLCLSNHISVHMSFMDGSKSHSFFSLSPKDLAWQWFITAYFLAFRNMINAATLYCTTMNYFWSECHSHRTHSLTSSLSVTAFHCTREHDQ